MLSKRFALIVGGTIGGLGAVLSITPPQFGTSGGLSGSSLSGGSLSGASLATSSTPAAAAATTTSATPAPAAAATTAAATPAPAATTATTKKKSKKSTTKKAASTTSANATAATPSAAATTAAPAPAATQAKSAGVSGTFTGDSAQTRFGPVQVQITIENGKITNAKALTYPTESFRDQQINSQAIPYLIQETLQAQSSNIQGVGGASYTSQGWYESLVSALSKAGM